MQPNLSRWIPWPAVVGRSGPTWRMVVLAVAAAFVVASICCCSKSTQPRDVKYNIYIGAMHLAANDDDSTYSRIYIYDADSLTILDSICREHEAESVCASPDGRSLYVVDRIAYNLASRLSKIEIHSKQVVWVRENLGGYPRFVSNGKFLLCGKDVLKPDDGTRLRRFSDSLWTMFGPVSGTKVAAVRDLVVTLIDVTTGESSGRWVPRLSNGLALDVGYARLHPDGRRVLAIGLYGNVEYSWFVVGDVMTGETLFEYRVSLSNGEIAVSENGSVAVVTDPPGAWGYEQTLNVIDLDHLTLIRKFTNELALQSQVRFLPDNMHVALARPSGIYHTGPLQIVGLNGMSVRGAQLPSHSPFIGGLDIGPRP